MMGVMMVLTSDQQCFTDESIDCEAESVQQDFKEKLLSITILHFESDVLGNEKSSFFAFSYFFRRRCLIHHIFLMLYYFH